MAAVYVVRYGVALPPAEARSPTWLASLAAGTSGFLLGQLVSRIYKRRGRSSVDEPEDDKAESVYVTLNDAPDVQPISLFPYTKIEPDVPEPEEEPTMSRLNVMSRV